MAVAVVDSAGTEEAGEAVAKPHRRTHVSHRHTSAPTTDHTRQRHSDSTQRCPEAQGCGLSENSTLRYL